MAVPAVSNKCNYFHQTLELHFDYGAEVLRQILSKLVANSGKSLAFHLGNTTFKSIIDELQKKGVVHPPQLKKLYPGGNKEPNASTFDCTLLTLLFLNDLLKQSLSHNTKEKIKQLRSNRNILAHVPKAELPDKTNFNTTRNLLLELSKTIIGQKYKQEVQEKIDDLERKEFISCRSNLDIVSLRNEEFMVKLTDRQPSDQVDVSDTTYLRFGLTKWAKKFTRHIDLDKLLPVLKERGVISYTEKVDIENEYSKGEQAGKLIMKMLDETNERLWKFCSSVREISDILADLIENRNNDGADIALKLKETERDRIRKALTAHFKEDVSGSVLCEEIHVVVEEDLQYGIKYAAIEDALLQVFNSASKRDDYRVAGIKPVEAQAIEDLRQKRASYYKNAAYVLDEESETMSLTSVDALAEHVCKCLEQIMPGYGPKMQGAIMDECIAPKLFVTMQEEEIKKVLGSHLDRMPYGILMELERIQKEIKTKRTRTNSELLCSLRHFDMPIETTIYNTCDTRPVGGNLLIPAHEFKMLPANGEYTNLFIMKECIKFIDACLNSRKNGTIHFGIKGKENGLGTIIGIERAQHVTCKKTALNIELMKNIEICFEPDKVLNIKRCVRPFQLVPVDDGSIVLEMDVVPFSGYTDSNFFPVLFPPKGKQEKKLFVYDNDLQCEIISIPPTKQDNVVKLYNENIKERLSLEGKLKNIQKCGSSFASRLVSALTADSDYLTDQYIPIICTDKLSNSENEEQIRTSLDLQEAFLSSVAVFDFDSSVRLRKMIEKHDTAFRVTTANRNNLDETVFAGPDRIWMYCNGNTDLGIEEMTLMQWAKDRYNIVMDALSLCKQKVPQQRAILIFFAFESTERKTPMLHVAQMCIMSKFRNQCAVIAESNETIMEIKKNLSEIMPSEELNQHFHTGMSWETIANTLKTVFRSSTKNDFKLPCSAGTSVLMTPEEKRQLNFTDIDILSGDECVYEEMMDDDTSRRNRKRDEAENFYKGGDVSWWNFHYTDQVGKRDLHREYLQAVRKKLRSERDKLIEVETIRHQPGAGGSTAGRFLLWNLSQFSLHDCANAYRCCVVRQITECTGKQIYTFMSFKDKSPKPVAILVDNESEENLRLLQLQLDEHAYKYGQANTLFCLLINVSRVSVSYTESTRGEKVLKHELSKLEQSWFESKYNELESASEIDVKTLISFNVMRKNFDPKYIKELADEIVSEVKETEMKVLKCLSLVNTFDRDKFIPISTFDCLMSNYNYSLWDLKNKGPVGLVDPMLKHRNSSNSRNIWNLDITKELALLIKHKCDKDIPSEIMIISKALAEAILEYIMETENLSLSDIIEFVLSMAKDHVGERNPMSKQFVKIINGLFKTRQPISESKKERFKFSDMVMKLKKPRTSEDESKANLRVVNLMQSCFKITSDAMVGQQLSRFFIEMKRFEEAEAIIIESLELQKNSSYLLDTYGQIYRSKMETILKEQGKDFCSKDTAAIVNVAFKAIDKFIQAEKCDKTSVDIDGGFNYNCFAMEVKTMVNLLENFNKFSCYVDRENFLRFLNQHDFNTDESTFKEVAKECALDELRKNSDRQRHVAETLRLLEEREYQVKRDVYTVYTDSNEKLVLTLRERFENFYGTEDERSSLKFSHGVGLKSLMLASEKQSDRLQKWFAESQTQLNVCGTLQSKTENERDLLVVLGYKIIEMSNSEAKSQQGNVEDYQRLLRYSERLLEIQRSSSRPYLEAYLYFSILHWPSPKRLQESLIEEYICKPHKYNNILKDWKKAFDANFEVKSAGGHKNTKAKNYFVLGKGGLGCDLVDLECIRKEWKRRKQDTENRTKPPVKADNFWKEGFVADRLQRLTGVLDDSGLNITYQIKKDLWEYNFSIRSYYPNSYLSNRRVTFVLGFTWAELAAFDVEEAEQDEEERKSYLVIPKVDPEEITTGAIGGELPNSADNFERKAEDSSKEPQVEYKNPVALLNERIPGLRWDINKIGRRIIHAKVLIDGQCFDDTGSNEQLAKQRTAEKCLWSLFNISCRYEHQSPNIAAKTRNNRRKRQKKSGSSVTEATDTH